MKLILAPLAAAILLTSGPALAKPLSPAEVVKRHEAFGAKGDYKSMAGDYAENAVVLQPGTVVSGRKAIADLLNGLLGPKAKTPLKIDVVQIWQKGDVGFVTWTTNGGKVKGTDSFLVRGGKIQVQAVWVGQLPPGPPAKS
jgi:ketosteroid isomerase-like protein